MTTLTNTLTTLLINSIDLDNLSENATGAEKLRALADTFQAEYGYEVKRVGLKKACRNYLQGIPSSCTVPFYTAEIVEIMRPFMAHDIRPVSDQTMDLYYWNCLGSIVADLIKPLLKAKGNG